VNDHVLLADLERVLASEPLGLSCCALARRLHRRKSDVLAALSSDRRFAHSGKTHGSRWRLDAGTDRNKWEAPCAEVDLFALLDAPDVSANGSARQSSTGALS
jgi:hypothetical protein